VTEDIRTRGGKDFRVRARRKYDSAGNLVGGERHITDLATGVRQVVPLLNTRPYQSPVSYAVNAGRYDTKVVAPR